jgi:hypothetical protein
LLLLYGFADGFSELFHALVEGRGVPWDLLVKDVPEEHHHDLEYILDMLDWDANTDPEFAEHRLFEPRR